MAEVLSDTNRFARDLFAPLAPSYDRYARLLSLGQDPRWRSFLVSRVAAGPASTVLDVACGTGAVAVELARKRGCRVLGVDQSPEMLAEGRRRVAAASLGDRVELVEARAEALPFADGAFDALTVTYLLRYVEDPGATMRKLARAVRPGGSLAMLEFFVPPAPLARRAWDVYVDHGLPLLGRLVSPGWASVGGFLGESIRGFWASWPLDRLLVAWRQAGIVDVEARALTLGGGIVIWGRRGG